MIAMALSCHPKLLIADEPTTALDVTIQAQILDLLQDMKSRFGMSIMLITHAMGVVAEVAQRVVVMYAGKVVEEASVERLFANPRHPYTQGLIRSIPRLDMAAVRKTRLADHRRHRAEADRAAARLPLRGALQLCDRRVPDRAARRCASSNRVTRWPASTRKRRSFNERAAAQRRNLTKEFALKGGLFGRQAGSVHAVDGVDFHIDRGETFGLVGESGCGKSTTGRCVLRLIEPTSGDIHFEGKNVRSLERGRASPAAPRHPDHLSGSLRLAQSAHECRRDRRRGPDHPPTDENQAAVRRARRRAAGDRRPAGRPYGTLSERVLRRPAPAHRHRARARRRAQADHLRRAGVGA